MKEKSYPLSDREVENIIGALWGMLLGCDWQKATYQTEMFNEKIDEYQALLKKLTILKGYGYEKPERDFEEKYQDAIIRLDRLDEISSAAFTVNCHIKYFKEKIAEEDYEGAVLEADGLVRYAEKLVQTVKESVQ